LPRKIRDYVDEYAKYQGKPEQRKKRSSRNKARRRAIKLGKIKKGDSRDIDHSNGNPLDNSPKNLKAKSKKKNRSFPRNKKAGRKKLGKF
jgi:hypothetical protein